MKRILLSLGLLIGLSLVSGVSDQAPQNPLVAVAEAGDDYSVVLKASGWITPYGTGGKALECEALHEGKTMAVRITDTSGTLIDWMKPPTGSTQRYVNDYRKRNPTLGYVNGKGQSCASNCYATMVTIYSGQALKCDARPD